MIEQCATVFIYVNESIAKYTLAKANQLVFSNPRLKPWAWREFRTAGGWLFTEDDAFDEGGVDVAGDEVGVVHDLEVEGDGLVD